MKWNCVMNDKPSKKVEKNIYVELHSGSFRFTVAVSPLKREPRTVSPEEYNIELQRGRRCRVELLEPPISGYCSSVRVG